MKEKARLILIAGPTGVGKTDLVDHACALLAQQGLRIAVVNADMGQCYAPLSIGTAKPNLTAVQYPHELFDSIATPSSLNAYDYRLRVQDLAESGRYDVLLCVGGSCFYHESLLYTFTPSEPIESARAHELAEKRATLVSSFKLPQYTLQEQSKALWDLLKNYDNVRADMLHPHDRYRIERALDLLAQGHKPSSRSMVFDPVSSFKLCHIERSRDELKRRIAQRCGIMLQQGWLEEVRSLSQPWKDFLRKKNIIGYRVLLDLEDNRLSLEQAQKAIVQETNAYAKRQMTYARRLLEQVDKDAPGKGRRLKLSALESQQEQAELLTAWIVGQD